MNENPIEGLRRETREEAGIEIDVVTCFSDFWVGDIGEPSHMGISFSANYVAGELVTSVENSVSGGGGAAMWSQKSPWPSVLWSAALCWKPLPKAVLSPSAPNPG